MKIEVGSRWKSVDVPSDVEVTKVLEFGDNASISFKHLNDQTASAFLRRDFLSHYEPAPNLPASITLLDPDDDHVEIYVDGKRAESTRGLSHTSVFLSWLKEHGIKLPFEIEYRHVDVAEEDEAWWPPETLDEMKERCG